MLHRGKRDDSSRGTRIDPLPSFFSTYLPLLRFSSPFSPLFALSSSTDKLASSFTLQDFLFAISRQIRLIARPACLTRAEKSLLLRKNSFILCHVEIICQRPAALLPRPVHVSCSIPTKVGSRIYLKHGT